jgi:hypothetical protein
MLNLDELMQEVEEVVAEEQQEQEPEPEVKKAKPKKKSKKDSVAEMSRVILDGMWDVTFVLRGAYGTDKLWASVNPTAES